MLCSLEVGDTVEDFVVGMVVEADGTLGSCTGGEGTSLLAITLGGDTETVEVVESLVEGKISLRFKMVASFDRAL